MAIKRSLAGSPESSTSPEALVEAAFAKLSDPDVTDEALRLFPDGLGVLELELDSGAGARVSLKLTARRAESTSTISSETEDVRILLDGDVEALFNAEGHHVIALIAQSDLQKRSPMTIKKLEAVLAKGGRDLLTAATFPDDIRSQHPETKPFHFVDIPFEDGGVATPPLPPPPHVISKIAEFTATLKQGGSAQNVADAASWLIHLFGDIHQPLHCIEHVSTLHPAGDRGGNSFLIKGSPRNLHSLWDSSVDFRNQPEQSTADSIIQEHSRTDLAADLQITDPEKWARASFALAKKFAYGPLHENPKSPPKPSAAYLKKAEEIGRRQAALAGYRLADRLKQLFT